MVTFWTLLVVGFNTIIKLGIVFIVFVEANKTILGYKAAKNLRL